MATRWIDERIQTIPVVSTQRRPSAAGLSQCPTRLNGNLISSSATQDQLVVTTQSKWRIRDHIQDTQWGTITINRIAANDNDFKWTNNIKIASWSLVVQEQTEIPTRHLFTATTIHFSWPLVNSIAPESLREKTPPQ